MRQRPWAVLGSVALGQLMAVIDVTILNVALPTIATALHASMVGLEWALAAYSLILVGLVPTFGRVSDIYGRKRMFIAGMLVFAAGSALCAASPQVLWLVGARIVQAVGGALITANSLPILTDVFPRGRRGVAMGVQAILLSAGAAIGPTIGGYLVTRFGWESVFLINVPLGIVATAIAAIVLPPLKPTAAHEPVDFPGAALLLVGLCTALLALTRAPDWGWHSALTLGLLVFGLVTLYFFVRRERVTTHPIVPLRLFGLRAFTAGQLAGMMSMFAMHSLTFVIPFYWQSLRGYNALQTGIFMIPLPVALMAFAPFAGRVSDVRGTRGIATLGLTIVAVALGFLAQIDAETPVAGVLWRFGMLGAGLGMFLPSNNNGVMSAVPQETRGVAAGLLALARFTGQSLGVALGGTVFVQAAGQPLAHLAQAMQAGNGDAFLRGLHAVCYSALALAAIGAFLSFQRGGEPPPP